MISTSEIKVSCVIHDEYTELPSEPYVRNLNWKRRSSNRLIDGFP